MGLYLSSVPPFVPLANALAGRGVALTIDDAIRGAADAARLARRHGHAVTLFVNSGQVQSGAPHAFLVLNALLDGLDGRPCDFEGEAFSTVTVAHRQGLRARIKTRLCVIPDEQQRLDLVTTLASRWGVTGLDVPPHFHTLSRQDLVALRDAGVDLQNHGVSHADHRSLSGAQSAREIREGRAWLQRELPDDSRCSVRAGVACYQQGCISAVGLARTLVQLGTWRRYASVFRLIVANSHALADTLRENDVRVDEVIPNGTREVPPRPPLVGPPTVVFAGRLVPQKGVDLLLQAMALVVRQLPDARLIITGEGRERARIEHRIVDMGLRAHVTLHGHIEHPALAELLAPAWVQAVPSRSPEPGANVIPEAMMRATAVVTTRFDGPPEGLRDGVTGFLVPPFDAVALANRLLALLSDSAQAERMGQAGRDIALAELTTGRMIDRFESAYAGLAR